MMFQEEVRSAASCPSARRQEHAGTTTRNRTGRQQQQRHFATRSSALSLSLLFVLLFVLLSTTIFVDGAEMCKSNSLRISPFVKHRLANKALTIGHRGGSSHLPENTLPAYRLALELGADYIQPDILATSDGQLVAIHTADLNLTTNIAEKFPESRAWYSPFVERMGYWVFNFTLAELRDNVKVHQNIEAGRANMYDEIFRIPTLTEILNVLNKWNTEDLPLIVPTFDDNYDDRSNNDGFRPSLLELTQSGLYLELKDTAWLRQEAGLDLIQLLFQHFEQNSALWDRSLRQCYGDIPYDMYRVPPLVLQSFDIESLREFRQTWLESGYFDRYAQPKYMLLTDNEDCWEDAFWDNIEDDYGSWLEGLAAEKICLIDPDNGDYFIDMARRNNLILHAYTERPEQDYVEFGEDSLEETQFLICELGASGIFSESISTAILASSLPCPTPFGDQPYCAQSKTSTAFIGLGTFILGVVLTAVAMYCCCVGKSRGSRGGVEAPVGPVGSYHDRAPPTTTSPSPAVVVPPSPTNPDGSNDNINNDNGDVNDHDDSKYMEEFGDGNGEGDGDHVVEMTTRPIV